MRLPRRAPRKARIEMIPLIDSMFLILVYFIYAFLSMSVHRGVPLELPKAATAVEEKIEHHGISVTREGNLFLNKEAVSRDGLKVRLREIQAQAPSEEQVQIYLYGDRQAPHGRVVTVLDMLREAGLKRVFIETDKENDFA